MSLKERLKKDFLGAHYVMSNSAEATYRKIKESLYGPLENANKKQEELREEISKLAKKIDNLEKLTKELGEKRKKLFDELDDAEDEVDKVKKKVSNEAIKEIKKSNLVRASVPDNSRKTVMNVFITKEEAKLNIIKNMKRTDFSNTFEGGNMIKAALEESQERALAKSLGKALGESSKHIKKSDPIAEALRPIIWGE